MAQRAMTTKDHDTDPSTPSARRSAPPMRRVDGTDPGVGPPTETALVKQGPLNVVVPTPRPPPMAMTPVAAEVTPIPPPPGLPGGGKKDSVELLLEGVVGPRPDRSRTTPQSGGEAAATYHAEHGIRASRAASGAAAKVLVDRPATPRAIPVAASARRTESPDPALRATDPTLITRDDLLRRVVIAFVAGLLVVFGVFAAFRITAPAVPNGKAITPSADRARAAATAPPAEASHTSMVRELPAAPAPPAAESSAAGAGVPEVPAASADTPATVRMSSTNRATASGSGSSRRHRTKPAASGDLGEFKTAF